MRPVTKSTSQCAGRKTLQPSRCRGSRGCCRGSRSVHDYKIDVPAPIGQLPRAVENPEVLAVLERETVLEKAVTAREPPTDVTLPV